jgi:hypothetical protein
MRSRRSCAVKPLYFYAHEEPGEVLCHNVDLSGGRKDTVLEG